MASSDKDHYFDIEKNKLHGSAFEINIFRHFMFQVIVRELDRYILRYKTIINYYAV